MKNSTKLAEKQPQSSLTIGGSSLEQRISKTKSRIIETIGLNSILHRVENEGEIFEVLLTGEEIIINGELLQLCKSNKGKWALVNIATGKVQIIFIKGTDEQITYIWGYRYNFCGKRIVKSRTNKRNIVYFDANNCEEFKLNIKGTNEEIDEMGDEQKIIGLTVRKVRIKGTGEFAWIDTRTLERINLREVKSNGLITDIGNSGKLNNKRLSQVRVNNERIWVDYKTLEKIDTTIKGTKIEIRAFKKIIKIGKFKFQKVDIKDERRQNSTINSDIGIYINPETLEPLMFEGEYVLELEKLGPKAYKGMNIEGRHFYIKL